MAINDYYQKYWSEEGTVRVVHHTTYPELRDVFAPYVKPTSDCLDVGCGPGLTSGLWLKEHGASYVGVDISEPAIEEARSHGLDARLIEDATSLPFEDNSFDVVVCTEVLEHLFEPQAAVTEMLRVLRPGGHLIATVPNVAYWRRRVDLVMGVWDPAGDYLGIEEPWRDPHIRFFSTQSLRHLMRSCGFRNVRVTGHRGTFLSDIPSKRLKRRLRASSLKDRIPEAKQLLSGYRSGKIYRALERRQPGLLAVRLCAVATKPQPSQR